MEYSLFGILRESGITCISVSIQRISFGATKIASDQRQVIGSNHYLCCLCNRMTCIRALKLTEVCSLSDEPRSKATSRPTGWQKRRTPVMYEAISDFQNPQLLKWYQFHISSHLTDILHKAVWCYYLSCNVVTPPYRKPLCCLCALSSRQTLQTIISVSCVT